MQLAVAFLAPVAGLPTALALTVALMPLGNVYVGGVALGVVAAWYAAAASAPGADRPVLMPGLLVWFWGGWMVVAAVSTAFNGATPRQVGQLAEFLFYGGIATLSYNLAASVEGARQRILAGLIAAAWLLGVASIVAARAEATDLLFGRNEGAFFLLLSGVVVPLAVLEGGRLRRRWFAWATIGVSVGAIVVSDSRAAMAGAVLCGAGWLAWRIAIGRRRGLSALVLSIGVAGGAFFVVLRGPASLVPGDFSTLERVALLQQSYALFLERPLVGHGWNALESLLRSSVYTELVYPHPHNTYARFAAELGVAGLGLLLVLYGGLFLRGLRAHRAGLEEAALLALLLALTLSAMSMVAVVFYGASRALVTAVLLGVACSYRSGEGDRRAADGHGRAGPERVG
ncbi:MAG: O-antigen ligase family protein [Gemmatimonadota bacterium]